MTTLTVLPSGKSCEVAVGTSLLNALQTAGEPIICQCSAGKSEACHVFVPVGRKSLSKIQRAENEKLDAMVGVSSASRLACQATLSEDAVTVEILK